MSFSVPAGMDPPNRIAVPRACCRCNVCRFGRKKRRPTKFVTVDHSYVTFDENYAPILVVVRGFYTLARISRVISLVRSGTVKLLLGSKMVV